LSTLKQLVDDLEKHGDTSAPIDLVKQVRALDASHRQLLEALGWISRRCPSTLVEQPLHTIHQEMTFDAGACSRAAIAAAKELT